MSYNKEVKKKNIIGMILVFIFLFGVFQKINIVQASLGGPCNAPTTGVGVEIPSYPQTTSHTVTIDLSANFDPDKSYKLTAERGYAADVATSPSFFINKNSSSCNNGQDCVSVYNGKVTWEITSEKALIYNPEEWIFNNTSRVDLVWSGTSQCDVGDIKITRVDAPGQGCTLKVFQNRNGQTCYQNPGFDGCFVKGIDITVVVTNLKNTSGKPWEGKVGLRIDQIGGGEWDGSGATAVNGKATLSFNPGAASPPTEYKIYVEERKWVNEDFPGCEFGLTVQNGCNTNQCEPEQEITPSAGVKSFELCNQIPESGPKDKCLECFNKKGIWTAIGCIDTTSTQGIVSKLMTIGMSIAGGIALLMILAAAFLFATSEGEPKRTSEAKEILTSAIIGLIFIIFSVTVLEFIGVNILKIPGFGGP